MQKIKGDLKDAAGKALGDHKLHAEGKADKANKERGRWHKGYGAGRARLG